MTKPDWVKTGVEATVSVAFVSFAFTLIFVSPPGISDIEKYLVILFLYSTWIFLHFQLFATKQTNLREPKREQIMIDRAELEDCLGEGLSFVGALDQDHVIVEGPTSKIKELRDKKNHTSK